MLTFAQIQEQAFTTATEKGWHERPLRTLGSAHNMDNDDCPWNDDETFANPATAGMGCACNIAQHYGVDHDRVLAKHALMHTELTEMHECLDAGELVMIIDPATSKPEGLVVEAADAVIRVADTTAALGVALDVQLDNPNLKDLTRDPLGGCLSLLARTRQAIDRATEAARIDNWVSYAAQLSFAVGFIAAICANLDLDLGAAIEAKMAYNKTRPHRHGGKQA